MIKDIIANDFKVYLHLVFGKHLDNEITHTNISINKELSDTLKKICINYVNEIKEEEKFIEDFNIVGSNDGVIEKYDITNNFMGIPNILDLLNDENRLTINDEDELKEYKYFIIEVLYRDEKFYFVRKPAKPNALKKGMVLTKDRGKYKLLEENELLVFDDKIDFIATNDEYYIFKRSIFESSYDFTPVYDYLVNSVLENEILKEKIDNFDELLIDINNNLSLKKRVANMFDSQNTTLFLEKIDTTIKINERYGLNLQIEDNKLVYEDREQAKHIVALMQDAYYETYIGKEQGTDTRR